MAIHFVYSDPDKSSLAQGDVLEKTSDFVPLLLSSYPLYANDPEYIYFMVLTQGCDLVRRPRSSPCPYITLAPARPLQIALHQEAVRYQQWWQKEMRVLSAKNLNSVRMFLERILDNNESGYFYLHTDASVGIHQQCCVFLRLAFSVAVEHYDLCLRAKIAQLKEPFPAKLGWLIGEMYNQVGTPEWDTENPERNVRTVASEILRDTFVNLPDEKIEEGMKLLQSQGGTEGKTAAEVFHHIQKTPIVPRSRLFKDRAELILAGLDFGKEVYGRLRTALKRDEELKKLISAVLGKSKDEPSGELADEIVGYVVQRLSAIMAVPEQVGRDPIMRQILASIMQDAAINQILKR
jgi:hypothetical protein